MQMRIISQASKLSNEHGDITSLKSNSTVLQQSSADEQAYSIYNFNDVLIYAV